MTSCASVKEKVKQKVSKKVDEKINDVAKKAREKVKEKIGEKVKDTIGDKLEENGIDPSIGDAIGDSLSDIIKGDANIEDIGEKFLGGGSEVEIQKEGEIDKTALSSIENASFMEGLDTNLKDKELIESCREVLENNIFATKDSLYVNWVEELSGNSEGARQIKVYLDKERQNQKLEKLSDVVSKAEEGSSKENSLTMISSQKDNMTYIQYFGSKLGMKSPYDEKNLMNKKAFDVLLHLNLFYDEIELISAKIIDFDGDKVLLYESKNTKTQSTSKVWYSLRYGYPIKFEYKGDDFNSLGKILDIKIGVNVEGMFEKPEGLIWTDVNNKSE